MSKEIDIDATELRWAARSDGDAYDVHRLIARVRSLQTQNTELKADLDSALYHQEKAEARVKELCEELVIWAENWRMAHDRALRAEARAHERVGGEDG